MPLEIIDLAFKYKRNSKHIFKNINMKIKKEERIGLIGPSGCGKTTLAKVLAGHEKIQQGKILLDGKEYLDKKPNPVQLIYQHPEESINPLWKMNKVLEESGQLNDEIINKINIEKDWLNRFPNELSGGELQRFSVARAIFSGAKFLIADEITTMLDSISQSQIWSFLLEEVKDKNIGMIIITHNEELAKKICRRIIDFREFIK